MLPAVKNSFLFYGSFVFPLQNIISARFVLELAFRIWELIDIFVFLVRYWKFQGNRSGLLLHGCLRNKDGWAKTGSAPASPQDENYLYFICFL